MDTNSTTSIRYSNGQRVTDQLGNESSMSSSSATRQYNTVCGINELEGIKKPSVAELVNKFKCKSGTTPSTTVVTNNISSRATKINNNVVECTNIVRPTYSGYGPDSVVIKPLQEDDIQLKDRPIRVTTTTTGSNNQQVVKDTLNNTLNATSSTKSPAYYDDTQASLSSLILRGFEQDTVKRSSLSNDSRLPVPSNLYIETEIFPSNDIMINDNHHHQQQQQQNVQDHKDQSSEVEEEDIVIRNNYIRASNHQPFRRRHLTSQSTINHGMPNNTNNSDEDHSPIVEPNRIRHNNLHNNNINKTNNNNPSSMATLQSMMMAAIGDQELSKNLTHLNMDTMQIDHHPAQSRHRHAMFSDDHQDHPDHLYHHSYMPADGEDDDYYYYGHGDDDFGDDYIDSPMNHHDHMMHHHHHLDGDDHIIMDDIDQIGDEYLEYALHTIVEEDENSEEEEEEEGEEEEDDNNISQHDEMDGIPVIDIHRIPTNNITRSSNEDELRVVENVNDLNSATTKQQKPQIQPTQPLLLSSTSPSSSSTKSAQSTEAQPITNNRSKDTSHHKRSSDIILANSPLTGGGLLMPAPLRISNSVSLPDISVKSSSNYCYNSNNDLHPSKQSLRAQSPNSKNPLFLALEHHHLLEQQRQKILAKKIQKKNRRINGDNHDHNSKKDDTCPQLSSLDLKNLDDKMIDDLMVNIINSSSASSASSDSSSTSGSMDMDDACARITTNGDDGCRIVGIHEDEQHDHFMFSHHHGIHGSLDDLRGSSDEDEELMMISSSAAAIATEKLQHKNCILNNSNNNNNSSNQNQSSSFENRSSRNVNNIIHQSSDIDSHHIIQDENNKDNLLSPSSQGHNKKALSMSVTNQNNSNIQQQQHQDLLQQQQQQQSKQQQQDSSLFMMAPSKLEQYFTSGLIKSSSSSSNSAATTTITDSGVTTLDDKQHLCRNNQDDDEIVNENERDDEDDEDTRKVSSPCDTNVTDGQSLFDGQAATAVNRILSAADQQLLPARTVARSSSSSSAASNMNHCLSSSPNMIQLQIESLMKQMLKTLQENSNSNKKIQQKQKNSSDDKIIIQNNSPLKEFEYNMHQLAQLIAASQFNNSHNNTNSPLQSINSINLDASSPNKQHPNQHQRAQSATSTSTSNNSDYGSDTQSSSADCLLQPTDEECLLTTNIPMHHDQTSSSSPSPPNSSNNNIPNLSQNHRQNRLHQQQHHHHHHQHRLVSSNSTSNPTYHPISSSRQTLLAATLTEQVPQSTTTATSPANSNQQQQQQPSAPVAIELCQKMIESFKKLTEQQQDTISPLSKSTGNESSKSDTTLPGVVAKNSLLSNDRSSSEKVSAADAMISEKTDQEDIEKTGSRQEEMETLKDADYNHHHHHNQERQLMRDEAYEYLKNQISNIMDTIQLQPNLSSLQANNSSSANSESEVIAKKFSDDETSHEIILNEQMQQHQSRPNVIMKDNKNSDAITNIGACSTAHADKDEKGEKDGNMKMTEINPNHQMTQVSNVDQNSSGHQRDESVSKMAAQPQPQPRNRHKTRINYNQSPSPVTNGSPSKPGPVVVTIGGGSTTPTSGAQGRANIINVVNVDHPNQNVNMARPLRRVSGIINSALSLTSPVTSPSSNSPSSNNTSDNDDGASPIAQFSNSTPSYNALTHYGDADNKEEEEDGFFEGQDANHVKTDSSSQLQLSKKFHQPKKPRRTTKTLINATPPTSNCNTTTSENGVSINAINTSALTATVRIESPLSMSIATKNNKMSSGSSSSSNNNNSNNSQVKLDHQCVSHTTLNIVGSLDSKNTIDRSSLDEEDEDQHDKNNTITGENDNNQEDSRDLSSINSEQQQHLQQQQQQKRNNISSSTNQQQAKRKSSFYRPGSPVPSQLSLDLSNVDKTAPPPSTSGAMIRNFAMGALSPRVATSSSTSKMKQTSSDDDDSIGASIETNNNKEALKKSSISKSTTTSTPAALPSMTDSVKQEQQQVAMSRSAAKALALAQKYNYSPSLMVAAKLGDNITNRNTLGVGGKRATNQLSQLQQVSKHNGIDYRYNSGATTGSLPPSHPGQSSAPPLGSTTGSLRRQNNNTIQGPVRVSGEVCFSISFQTKLNSMYVHVVECRDLAPVDKKRQRSNPYIKLYLLPDRSKGGKRKSAIKKADLNPRFDETFTFSQLCLRDLEQRTLWLSVWHKDRLGRNDFLGEILLPLQSATQTLLQTNRENKWYKLQERFEITNAKRTNMNHNVSLFNGELFTALKFVPSNTDCRTDKNSEGDLHIVVKEAHNLRAINRQIGLPNPYCKCQLISNRDGHRLDKQKSPTLKRTINPKWNHKFIFNQLIFGQLKELCLELSVWDKDSLVSNEFLGGIRLGASSSNSSSFSFSRSSSSSNTLTSNTTDTNDKLNETTYQMESAANERQNQLWNQMMARPNMWVYGELILRRARSNIVLPSRLSDNCHTHLDNSHQNSTATCHPMDSPPQWDSNHLGVNYLNRTGTIRSTNSSATTDDRESINSSSTATNCSVNNENRIDHQLQPEKQLQTTTTTTTTTTTNE